MLVTRLVEPIALVEGQSGVGEEAQDDCGSGADPVIVSKNHPKAHREGSVGQVLRGKEVLIGQDGVVSARSEHPLNDHYAYAEPGDSERVFGPNGTVRTGRPRHLGEDGFLFIHGRADDVIVLDNGKKVVVPPIEVHLKTDPAIAEWVLFCPAQTELVAVVSPVSAPADVEAIAARLALSREQLSAVLTHNVAPTALDLDADIAASG